MNMTQMRTAMRTMDCNNKHLASLTILTSLAMTKDVNFVHAD